MFDSEREPDAPEDNPQRVNVVPEITLAPPRAPSNPDTVPEIVPAPPRAPSTPDAVPEIVPATPRPQSNSDTVSQSSFDGDRTRSEPSSERSGGSSLGSADTVSETSDALSGDTARSYQERQRRFRERDDSDPDSPSVSAAQDVEPSAGQIGQISLAGVLILGAFILGGPFIGAAAAGAITASMNSSQKNKTSLREAKAQALYEKERANAAELKNRNLQRQIDNSRSNGISAENDRDSVDLPPASNSSVGDSSELSELPERQESTALPERQESTALPERQESTEQERLRQASERVREWLERDVVPTSPTGRDGFVPDTTPSTAQSELGRG